jgi:hypothetical protein
MASLHRGYNTARFINDIPIPRLIPFQLDWITTLLEVEDSPMKTALFSVIASTYLLASSTLTYASCSTTFTEKFAGADRIVDSLRPDKPGQMRVFASDGSEFTAGQALWMKGQLRSVLQVCARGDEVSAASSLHGVTDLLSAHHRAL